MELIVFDLDGTLLNANSEISRYTRETLQLMSQNGIAYTVATGRTLHSAKSILNGHGFVLPHIYSNGVLIWDPHLDNVTLENTLTTQESQQILYACSEQNIGPFVSVVDTQNNHFIYHDAFLHPHEMQLLADFCRHGDIAFKKIEELSEEDLITNISLLGHPNAVAAVEQHILHEPHLIAYSGPALEGATFRWMDIHHSQANKGGAVAALKQQLGSEKVICFGDNDNDLSMFHLADEAFAPANANARVKDAATEVIGHHDDDGIARFLRKKFQL